MSKPDLARKIALTPQAVNGIVDELVRDGLTRQGGQRGGVVGHPSTLYTLSPQGAFSIGLKLSKHGLEALLVDFIGTVIYRAIADGPRMSVDTVETMIRGGFDAVLRYTQISGIDFSRVIGIGLAIPGDVFYIQPELKRTIERVICSIAKERELPVVMTDHGIAAATAELMIGATERSSSFLYISIGQTIESGLVLDGKLYDNGRENSHRIAHMPIGVSGTACKITLLQDIASIDYLDSNLKAAGFRSHRGNTIFEALQSHGDTIDHWVQSTAKAISFVALSAQALTNMDAILLTADLPNQLQNTLISEIRRILSATDFPIEMPRVEIARLGANAVALGSAILPIYRQEWPGHMYGVAATRRELPSQ